MEWNQAATSRDQRIDTYFTVPRNVYCQTATKETATVPAHLSSIHLQLHHFTSRFDALASCPTLDLPPHDPLDPVHPVSRSPHPFRQVRSSTSELPLPHLDHPSPPCSSSRHSSSSCQEGTISRSSRLSWVRMGKFSRESPSWIWRGRRWRSIKGGFMGLGIGQR